MENHEEPNTITVEARTIYGAVKYYPISEHAKIMAKLVGTKTLTDAHIIYIKLLGYVIRVKQTQPETL